MFKPINLITDTPALINLKVYKYVTLADISQIKPWETYLMFKGRWSVWRLGNDRVPRLCGYFPDIQSAMHRALR